jgi:hypothetical protein
MKGGVPCLREAARGTHAKRDRERKTENTSMKWRGEVEREVRRGGRTKKTITDEPYPAHV